MKNKNLRNVNLYEIKIKRGGKNYRKTYYFLVMATDSNTALDCAIDDINDILDCSVVLIKENAAVSVDYVWHMASEIRDSSIFYHTTSNY